MKNIFYATWALLSLLVVGIAVFAAWAKPGWGSGFLVVLAGYYAFCFFQLIHACYRPWGLLGPRRRGGYWLCLIVLPLALLPLQAAYEVWERGAYVVEDDGRVRLTLALVRQGLLGLQEQVGHAGPMLVMLVFAVMMIAGLVRLLKTQVVH